MIKVNILIILLFFLTIAYVTGENIIVHIANDDFVKVRDNSNEIPLYNITILKAAVTPKVSDSMPVIYDSFVLIDSPKQVIEFFISNGIDPDLFKEDYIPVTLKRVLCSICEERYREFDTILLEIARQHSRNQFDTYIIKVGDLYWTYYA